MKANESIRVAARKADVRLWEIAENIGISESCLMKWLRFPLDPERETQIMDAIKRLEEMRNA